MGNTAALFRISVTSELFADVRQIFGRIGRQNKLAGFTRESIGELVVAITDVLAEMVVVKDKEGKERLCSLWEALPDELPASEAEREECSGAIKAAVENCLIYVFPSNFGAIASLDQLRIAVGSFPPYPVSEIENLFPPAIDTIMPKSAAKYRLERIRKELEGMLSRGAKVA